MKTTLLIAASVILVALSLSGCATSPKASGDITPSQGDTVTVTLVSESELRAQYGRTPSDNPFYAPTAAVFAKPYDYIVLRLTATVGATSSLEILQADARNEKDKIKASYYDRKQFAELSTDLTFDPQNINVRQSKVQWYYLPADKRIRLKAGKTSWIFILVGTHPLPPSLVAGIRVLLNGEEQDFTIPIPDVE
jgi:predicted small secreted protein